ncbi:hypothetical protein [Streptomyces sp. NPDC092952]|uniref:hypothetical protein n=1 Tax=Streptomyces sp. NPDC092952 TaxID=3366018 RepID=UPI0038132CC5
MTSAEHDGTHGSAAPAPVEITPVALDITRHEWAYPCGNPIPPGTPIIFRAPERCDMPASTVYEPGTPEYEREQPIAVLVVTVTADGTVRWHSHVGSEETTGPEFAAEHAELLLQAYSEVSAYVQYRVGTDQDGNPVVVRRPGR